MAAEENALDYLLEIRHLLEERQITETTIVGGLTGEERFSGAEQPQTAIIIGKEDEPRFVRPEDGDAPGTPLVELVGEDEKAVVVLNHPADGRAWLYTV